MLLSIFSYCLFLLSSIRGINFRAVSVSDIVDTLTLGVAFGLFAGKQIGIGLFSLLAVKLNLGHLPYAVNWSMLYGVAILSGIGFTMSLFIGSLAFEETRSAGIVLADERIGILIGSFLSGLVGYVVLNKVLKNSQHTS